MSFGLRTKNIKHNVRKKRPISGMDLDTNQLFIYTIAGVFLFFIVFIANIWFIWKIIIGLFIIILSLNLSKKYDDSSINNINDDYGRTKFEWFRIYIKKSITGNSSVDKGNNYNYFKK